MSLLTAARAVYNASTSHPVIVIATRDGIAEEQAKQRQVNFDAWRTQYLEQHPELSAQLPASPEALDAQPGDVVNKDVGDGATVVPVERESKD